MPGPRSPLKRVTRARAAAKVVGPGTKTAKAVTAAAKAKAVHSAAASTSAPSTSTTTTTRPLKRKSPSDEDEAEDHEQPERKQAMLSSSIGSKPARGRGRPKKAETQPEPALPSSTRGRGRPKKADETATAAPAPVRPIKATRAKKTAPATEITVQPSQKTTRTRPAMAATAGTAARAPGRPALKKTVKFEEPEKENIAPAPAARASTKASTVAAGGLRGKPVRKAAGAATRTTRTTKASGAAENEDKPLPLSPKKVNQLSMNRSVESDDELAMDDKVPVGPLKKAPVKAVMGATKALKSSIDQKPSSSTVENDENALMGGAPEANLTLMLGTPAKRLPASPWKGSIKSAARRVEGLFGAPIPTIQEEGQASQVPVKMGLLNTPAKRHPLSIPISFGVTSGTQPSPSPFKFSLLSSPAKRSIMSPIKSLPPKIEEEEEEPRSPAPKPTLLASPVTVAVETADEAADVDAPADEDDEMIMVVEEEEEDEDEDNAMPDSPSRAPFPGRLSAVLPRHADPALPDNVVLEEGEDEEEMEEDSAETIIEEVEVEAVDGQGERMVLDLDSIEVKTYSSPASSPNTSPERPVKPPFGLREKDLNPYGDDTDSEEEATRQFVFTAGPATPSLPTSGTPSTSNQPTRSSARNAAKRMKVDSGLGFTPLASQLGQWTAGPSPLKTGISAPSPSPVSVPVDIAAHEDVPTPGAETTRSNFFEEEMLARPDAMQVEEEEAPVFQNEEIETPILEDVSFTEEDVALAAEANEMSLMEPEQIDDLVNTSNSNHDDTVSEASQEYGDENAIPVDSHVLPNDEDQALNIPPATPARVLRRREVHTVAKVPLKPADDSTPKSKLRKRHSISRVPVSRSTRSTTRNAAATSYEPTKGCEEDTVEEDEEEEGGSYIPPVTPDKEDIWAAMGTPARTPHKNLSPALLRGAVVFVDVYTSEGAEASGIFVELLNQMGARCIKDWKWNPDSSDSKIGITHVVYKDGGKRTLEKVRLSRGVVQCVGVSWVLDCERENKWLEEGPYCVDTSIVPRGGARRRKSMEPRAMTNMNGTLVPTPVGNNASNNTSNTTSNTTSNNTNSKTSNNTSKNTSSNTSSDSGKNNDTKSDNKSEKTTSSSAPPANTSTPTTPAAKNSRSSGRRASSLWVRTPEPEPSSANKDDSDSDKDNDEDTEWGAVLTPVPKTPAPEAIARYAANISPGLDSPTSSIAEEEEDEETKRQQMLTRTCPPKKTTFAELGEGLLSREKDERVLMRLMAARRKSLQFAPKVGSPLARSWRQ